jgi:t-SNARE complex subunit (syntaxin)
LRNRILEQKSALKRVEDQLETVREAADRNSQEQQEMLDDLKAVRKKINTFALLALALLVVSVALNVILYLHIVHLLP